MNIALPRPNIPSGGGHVAIPSGRTVAATSLLINGEAFPLRGSLTWGFQSGVVAQSAIFETQLPFVDSVVNAVDGGGGEVILQIAAGGDLPEMRFVGLAMMPTRSAGFTHDKVEIVDLRWSWPRTSLHRAYNRTRRSTDLATFGRTSVAGIGRLVDAPSYYVASTINGSRPFTALDIVKDVLGGLGLAVQDGQATDNEYVPSNVVVQGESVDSVLNRFMRLAGVDLYVDEDAQVVLYNNVNPQTPAEFESFLGRGANVVTSGSIKVHDNRANRPASVHTAFVQEREILLAAIEKDSSFDANQLPARTPQQAQAQLASGLVVLENVVRTIFDNQIAGVPRGSVVSIEAALAAFGTTFGFRPLTIRDIQDNFGPLAIFKLAPSIKQSRNPTGPFVSTTGPISQQAVSVLASILNAYRRMYRIPAPVMELLQDVKPLLADVVFSEAQARQPSEVFSTVTWETDIQTRFTSPFAIAETLRSFGTETSGRAIPFPTGAGPFSPIPADISVNPTDGVVTVTYGGSLSSFGAVQSIIPGEVRGSNDTVFKVDVFGQNGVVPTGLGTANGAFGLRRDWFMGAIVSVTQYVGTSIAVRWYDVQGSDPAVKALAGAAQNGPPINLFSRVDTARVNLPATNVAGANLRGFKNPSGLQGGAQVVNNEICSAIARQEAVRVYQDFADAAEGRLQLAWVQATVRYRPVAHIANVRFVIGSNGSRHVELVAPERRPKPELFGLLPTNIREQLGIQLSASAVSNSGIQ